MHFRPLDAATTDKLNAILTVGSLVSKSYRRRLWRAHQRRQLHGLDRHPAGRPERRHGAVAGGDPARARLRPLGALHPHRGVLRRHQGTEADRILRPDLARPDRLQPRDTRRRAACVVPAGGEQGAAGDRGGGAARGVGAARRAAPKAQAARRRQQRSAVDDCARRAGAEAAALNEAESKDILRAYGIATPQEALVTSLDEAVAPPNTSAIRSCSKRFPTHSRTSRTRAPSRSTSRPREPLRAAYERMRRKLAAAHARRHAGRQQFVAAGSSSCSACIAIRRWG